MSDYKRSVSTIAGMEETSSGASMSKRRRTSGGGGGSDGELVLFSSGERLIGRDAHLPEGLHEDMTVSFSTGCSVNSTGTVVSGEICPDRLLSCCSSNVKTSAGVANSIITTTTITPPLDAKGFESTVDSTTYSDFKLFSGGRYSLSEFSGDSEETMTLPAAEEVSKHGNILPAANIPPKEEIEEFFAMAEMYEQKRFAEKYNYDIAKDMPLEGRYQWVRLN
ncbi:cyclin-dependent kinase inhibitor 7-like [Senna tora]|uniref:Cyclin-dependent kinase inhibitor 7-like n=1 Tax=Senna tora TaxID=362788 RepID=A0A834XC83_9FABA|nr:cyclin-dependent kinase inhibitor 7-like [Senna tora]